MKITLTSVYVDDQKKALEFYTNVLGFTKKTDIAMGEFSWITVVSPQDPTGPELLLEPAAHRAVKPFQEALVQDGIPFTSFSVRDVYSEYQRMRQAGVIFTQQPVDHGEVVTAIFNDTCGNLLQITSP
jgi:catechol 2,3-dioxygenase-like lactoylglutathione lyase family enzyme